MKAFRKLDIKKATVVLAAFVALCTAYVLTIPAISVTQETARPEAGFYTQGQQDDAGITAGDPAKADATAGSTAPDTAPTSPGTTSEAEPAYPAQSFTETLKNKDDEVVLIASVEAPEGALPADSTLELESVKADEAKAAVEAAISYDGELAGKVQAEQAVAVNMTFKDAAGDKVEPGKAVTVKFTASEVRDIDEPVLVRTLEADKALEDGKLDENGDPKEAEIVEDVAVVNQDEEDTTEGTEDTLKFETKDPGEYTIAELEPVEGDEDATEDVDEPEADETEAEASAQSFYGELRDDDGNVTLTVNVEAPAGALPDGATMQVKPVESADVQETVDQAVSEATESTKVVEIQAADITFYDAEGNETEPQQPISVKMSSPQIAEAKQQPMVVHIDDEGNGAVVDTLTDKQLAKRDVQLGEDELAFDAAEFSVYAIAYTVDFHWEVDGEEYTFVLTGGDSVGLRTVLQALKVVGDEELDSFMGEIADVTFTNVELLAVVPVTEDTTAGKIKEEQGLKIAYSSNVTEKDIKEFDKKEYKAPDWALFSLKSFTSEEWLEVTMSDGSKFRIKVSDPVTDTAPGNMQTLNTEDTRAQGIKMWLFDYDLDQSLDNQDNKANTTNNKNDGINAGSDLKFLGWGAGNAGGGSGINDFTGLDEGNGNNKIRAIQGIVKNELNGGYPELNNGQSLAYLFDPTVGTEDRVVYGGNTKDSGNVTGLFEKNSEGYYIYDSDEHYAELGNDGKHFTVYTSTLAQTDKNGNNHTPVRAVGFFPFNTYADAYNKKYEYDPNNYGNNGTMYLNPDGINGRSGLNHHLGVAMEMDFVIPKDGKDENGNPIKFNFSGDDDMWVFIDDQLVLDIGGLHQPVDGTIDFSTGLATIIGKATTSTSGNNTGDNAIVTAAGAENPRGNNFQFYQALNMLNGGDGKVHTMKIFYMERGGCDSNCMISFNLPLVKAKADASVAKYDQSKNPVEPLEGVKFGLYEDAACKKLIEEVSSDENGVLLFKDLAIKEDNQTYYLKETKPLAGYKQNDTVYTLRSQYDPSSNTYSFAVMDPDGNPVGTIGQDPEYPVLYNEPLEPIELTVEKLWQDHNGNAITPKDGSWAEFQVKRYVKSEGDVVVQDTSQPCTFKVYRYNKQNNTSVQEGSDYTFKGGTQVTVNWGYVSSYYGGHYSNIMNYKESANGSEKSKTSATAPVTIQLPDSGEAAIYIRDENVGNEWQWGAGVVNITVNGTPYDSQPTTQHVVHDWAEDTGFTGRTLKLPDNAIDNDHPWTGKFSGLVTQEHNDSDGLDYSYKYYIVETGKNPNDATTVYVDGDDNVVTDPATLRTDETGTQTVINKMPPGALKLTKVVQIDGAAPESDKYNQVDGNYVFMVTNADSNTPTVSKYVQITVTNGVAASYKIADSEGELDSAESVTGSWAVVGNLAEGNYAITETGERNGLLLTDIARGDGESSAVDFDNSSVTVHVTYGDTTAVQTDAQATFTNNYYNNDGPDRISLDIVKTFEGLVSEEDIPGDFRVVVGYTIDGAPLELTLSKGQNETVEVGGEHIKVKGDTNDYTLSWHITNIPSNATNFKIKEVSYGSVAGYTFTSASLDGTDITQTAGDWHNMTVTAPTAVLTDVTNERETSDSPSNRKFELQDTDILLSKLTANQGTLVISKESLNYLEREAVQKGWPQEGGFKKPGIFFSIEEHPEGFSYGGKTVTFSEENGKTYVTFSSNASAQEVVFAVSYNSESALNNAALVNVYEQKTVSLDLVKVDQANTATKLSDAQFTIRKIKDTLAANSIAYDGDESDPVTTNAQGKAGFSGLTQGYYEIREKVAPAGYVFPEDNCFYIKVKDGVIYLLEQDLTKDPKDWVDTKTVVGAVTFTAAADATPASAQVGNTPGKPLPSTGGPGKMPFTLAGLVLVAAAGILLVRRKLRLA